MKLRTLEDLDYARRRVLLRADLNVPLGDHGGVADDFRIRAAVPTIRQLTKAGSRVVVCTHLGRPKGREGRFSTRPIAPALSEALGSTVEWAPDVAGPEAAAASEKVGEGDVLLLENLRFEPGETKNDPGFAEQLAGLGEVYVNDAFGASHRAHASIVGVPKLLPSAAGLLLADEVETLTRLLSDAPSPFVVVLGGNKVGDKIGVVRNLLGRADRILIGGGMAFTFLKARGLEIGRSILDEPQLEDAAVVAGDDRIVLPSDVMVAAAMDDPRAELVPVANMPPDKAGFDIGPATSEAFTRAIAGAETVFWNGPMGVFERDAFASGTRAVARAVADSGGYTVIGGGDTAAALSKFGLLDAVDFQSTGGGASLELLEGATLPGVEALMT